MNALLDRWQCLQLACVVKIKRFCRLCCNLYIEVSISNTRVWLLCLLKCGTENTSNRSTWSFFLN